MKGSMLNAKFIMDELEEKLEFFPPFEREGRILQEIEKSMHPNTIIELANAPEDIQERINKAKFEVTKKDLFDVILMNDKLSEASPQIHKLVKSFLTK